VVFENKFPSLQKQPPPPAVEGTAVSPVLPARGVCEVVVYSPDHRASLSTMPLRRITNLAHVWRDRTAVLGAREEIAYVFVFENRGEAVGVTLHHPHGQIYAFPFVPPIAQKELEASWAHHEKHGRCLFCDTVQGELADGRRIVLEGERFVAFVPFFARYPYEVYLAPKRHQATMLDWTAGDAEDLAAVLKGLLRKYDALFAKPFPYIMVCHQAPTDGAPHPEYHLHFEFYPPLRTAQKLKYLAGCEAGRATSSWTSCPRRAPPSSGAWAPPRWRRSLRRTQGGRAEPAGTRLALWPSTSAGANGAPGLRLVVDASALDRR
jgi:UDPglucose--hexose-1-phosphate uridylyltransferase